MAVTSPAVAETSGIRATLLDVVARAEPFDDAVERAWEPLRQIPPVNRALYVATAIGDHGLVWMGIAAAFAPRSERHRRNAKRVVAGLALESIIVNGAIKSVFKRTRPVHVGERPHHLRIPITSSFPSGHAASAVFSAMLLIDADPKLKRPLQALAVAVAVSRIHVRIHHASDVAGGVVVGWALGRAFRKIAPLDP